MTHRYPIAVGLALSLLATGALAQDQDGSATSGSTVPPGATRTAAGVTPPTQSATASSGFALTILHINEPGHPTNVVPGLGVPFATGGGSSSAFTRPWISRDGSHFVIEAFASTGSTTNDDVYITDTGLLVQEGTQASWAPAGETVGTLDDQVGIDNAGNVLITNNTNGTAPTTADDYVVLFDAAGTPTVLAKEGELIDPVLPALSGATWDDDLDSPVLTDDGRSGWDADGIDGTAGGTTDDDVALLGNAILAQKGQVPAGLATGTTGAWENFDLEGLYVNGDGSKTLIQGDTDAATTDDDVLALNGTVVLQENQPIPGGPFTEPIDLSGIVKGWVDSAGNWYARGNNDGTEQDWVVRNGTVVAFSGGVDEIVPGSGEFWDDRDFSDCFFAFDGNASGAFVIGGVTGADATANGVLVMDDGLGNRRVVCRENDPIDLDGNGVFDDDRFFNTFGNDDVILLDDGRVRFVATVRDGAGTAVDQGFFEVTPKWTRYGIGASAVNVLDLDGGGTTSIGGTFSPTTSGVVGGFVANAVSLGDGSFPLLGGVLLIDPIGLQFLLAGGTPVGGVSTLSAMVPNDPALIGDDFYLQSASPDPAQPRNFALSNGLLVTICP